MLRTEAVKMFLQSSGNEHLTSLYNYSMEVQVNVARDNGVRIGGTWAGKRWMGWKDPDTNEQWKSFRVPYNADSNPEYQDKNLSFDLAKHVEGIGMTGWNWEKKQSHWVGFDFDSITNHEQGLEDEDLAEIRKLVIDIPYVTLVKSTSGTGLHIYIHFDTPIPTNTHTEHAGLGRSILSILSAYCGYNFSASVDACGGVLWVYHRKQEGTDGLSLIKEGVPFESSKVPSNWREHIEVTAKRTKRIKSISKDTGSFSELLASIKAVKLDGEHKRLLHWFLNKSEMAYWWDSDHNMLVCHTFDLKKAHTDLELRGIFYTNSTGSSEQNCFAFPIHNGAWIVRRHSINVREHSSWITDPSGWTRCIYNDIPDFIVAARSNDGIENTRGEYVFASADKGLQALHDLDIHNIVVDNSLHSRRMHIKEKQDGDLVISIAREPNDNPVPLFLANKKGDFWERIIHRNKRKKDVYAPDFLVRHVISQDVEAGWWVYTRKKWIQQNRSNVMTVLLSQQDTNNRNDIEMYMAKAILNPWELVNIPFEEEYPGNRLWNRHNASLSCAPEEGPHETWNNILRHCGKSLDSAVKENEWCQNNAISTGSEYLLCWIASLFQKPNEPLPYLFFYGEQNTGKSTLHEALSTLFKTNRGYVRADNALINQQGFNSEICNAVLCVVEETNLGQNKDAGNRIKDWVTGKTISINTKYKTVYDVSNSTHWIQCANDPSYCPVLPGDTRIVVCNVPILTNEIPKFKLFQQLEKEKQAFLYTILNLELPEPDGRLSIPCVSSDEKRMLQNSNMSEIDQFLNDETTPCMGKMIAFDELFNQFMSWLPIDKSLSWSKQRFSLGFPKRVPFVKGKYGSNNVTYIGNISLDFSDKAEDFKWILNNNGRLERRDNDE